MDTLENISRQQYLGNTDNTNFMGRKIWCHECKFEFNSINQNSFECEKCKGYFCEEVVESQEQTDDPRQFVPYGEEQPQTTSQQVQIPPPTQPTQQQNFQNLFFNSPFRNLQSQFSGNNNNNNGQPIVSYSISIQPQHQFSSPLTRLNSLFTNLFPVTAQRAGITDNSNIDNILDFIMRNDTNVYGTPPASENSIQNLQKIQFKKNPNEDTLCECSICKDEFIDDEQVIKMPCNHTFHDNCLVSWLKRHNSCPTCRYELPTDNQDYEVRKQQRLQRQQRQQRNNQQTPRN